MKTYNTGYHKDYYEIIMTMRSFKRVSEIHSNLITGQGLNIVL